MRIESKLRIGNVGGRGAVRHESSAAGFHVDDGASVARASVTAGAASAAGIDALLALQAADDPVLKRRRQVRRASALLDVLEEMKTDLLVGGVTVGRLSQLMMLIAETRERSEPRLEALIDDIELRARIELAKHGIYPDS